MDVAGPSWRCFLAALGGDAFRVVTNQHLAIWRSASGAELSCGSGLSFTDQIVDISLVSK
jgi:hypothetical protein